LGYALLTAVGLVVLRLLAVTSVATALLGMGGASLAAATAVLASRKVPGATPGGLRAAVAHHLQHGRWLLVLAPLRWAADALPFVVLGVTGQLSQVASLRAAMNLTAPAIQLVGVTRLVLLPRFAEAYNRGRVAPLLRRAQLGVWVTGALFFAT